MRYGFFFWGVIATSLNASNFFGVDNELWDSLTNQGEELRNHRVQIQINDKDIKKFEEILGIYDSLKKTTLNELHITSVFMKSKAKLLHECSTLGEANIVYTHLNSYVTRHTNALEELAKVSSLYWDYFLKPIHFEKRDDLNAGFSGIYSLELKKEYAETVFDSTQSYLQESEKLSEFLRKDIEEKKSKKLDFDIYADNFLEKWNKLRLKQN